MKHLLIYLVASCLIAFNSAEDCSNPLLATFKFTSTNTPQAISGLKYCKSLQRSCCSVDTINSIQDKIQSRADDIAKYVAIRDKGLAKARDEEVPALKDAYQQLKDTYTKITPSLDLMASSQDASLKSSIQKLKSVMDDLLPKVNSVYANLETLKKNYKNQQRARTTCMIELLKLQASAWCLACDATYASKGVSGSTVTMSDRVCKRLQSACYDYISGSIAQNDILYIKMGTEIIQNLVQSMGTIASGTPSSITSSSPSGSGLTVEKIVETIPAAPRCTNPGECPWICTTLFKDGQLANLIAVIGGEAYETNNSRRLLEEQNESVVERKLEGVRRRLQSNTWDPDQDEAGVSVTFADDPAGVESSNSRLLGISFVCLMVGVIVSIF